MIAWGITFALLYYFWATGDFFKLIIISKLFIWSLNDDAFSTIVLFSSLSIHLIPININLIC